MSFQNEQLPFVRRALMKVSHLFEIRLSERTESFVGPLRAVCLVVIR